MRRKRSSTHSAASKPRSARRIPDESPGRPRGKAPELAACPGCGASYREGRWTWKSAPAGSYEQTCPACERIADGYPAGVLHVGGDFVAAHRAELIGLIRHVEERERAEHPLKRVMAIEDEGDGFVVKTTDAKLAASLGRALRKSHAGRLVQPKTTAEKGNLVRVHWARD
jgi:NMD protein affecting ribosome stability and mRNA decay